MFEEGARREDIVNKSKTARPAQQLQMTLILEEELHLANRIRDTLPSPFPLCFVVAAIYWSKCGLPCSYCGVSQDHRFATLTLTLQVAVAESTLCSDDGDGRPSCWSFWTHLSCFESSIAAVVWPRGSFFPDIFTSWDVNQERLALLKHCTVLFFCLRQCVPFPERFKSPVWSSSAVPS